MRALGYHLAAALVFFLPPLSVFAFDCGKAKWDVKTGSDLSIPDASAILAAQKSTTISELVTLAKPPYSRRRHAEPSSLERQLINVNAVLVEYKLEPDGDYHLILQEGGNYLVVEIPAPECARTSPLLKNIADARAEFDAPSHGLSATRTFKATATVVSISGIGFFDKKHGAKHAAPNDLEIHPVTKIQFRDDNKTTPVVASMHPADEDDPDNEEGENTAASDFSFEQAKQQTERTRIIAEFLEWALSLGVGAVCMFFAWNLMRGDTLEPEKMTANPSNTPAAKPSVESSKASLSQRQRFAWQLFYFAVVVILTALGSAVYEWIKLLMAVN